MHQDAVRRGDAGCCGTQYPLEGGEDNLHGESVDRETCCHGSVMEVLIRGFNPILSHEKNDQGHPDGGKNLLFQSHGWLLVYNTTIPISVPNSNQLSPLFTP